MIVDVHTHLIAKEHVLDKSLNEKKPGVPRLGLVSSPDEHYKNTLKADKVIVFGMYAPFTKIVVPNDYIAEYVKRDLNRLIGFMSIDPNDSDCIHELERCKNDLGLKGIKLAPIYQDFHPLDRELAYPIYKKAQDLKLPILFHMGTTYTQNSRLKYTQPILIDEVSHDFPDLKIVIAHLGHPWEKDTIVLIRKQPNVFADISALYYRPWQFYNSLRLATEYQVMDKLLLGTDFPVTTVGDTINGLNKICSLAEKAGLPPIDKDDIASIINRDALKLLNIKTE